MKYVLFYESGDDVRSKAPIHFPAHRARWQEFHARGTLLMVGPFANPEEFARGDPFVLNGVVRNWHVREWNEALAQP